MHLLRGARRAFSTAAASPAVTRECASQVVSFHETLPHWIGGRKVFAPASAPRMAKRYPATGELLCHVPVADAATVDTAVVAAHAAQQEWAAMSGAERGRILSRAASFLYEAHPELARLERLTTLVLENSELAGPLPEGLGDLAALETLTVRNSAIAGPFASALSRSRTSYAAASTGSCGGDRSHRRIARNNARSARGSEMASRHDAHNADASASVRSASRTSRSFRGL